jgi:hypothetical protein
LGARQGYGRLCLRAIFFTCFGIYEGILLLGLLVACSGNAEVALASVCLLSSKGATLGKLLSPFQLDLGLTQDGFSLLDYRPCRTPFLTVRPMVDASELRVCLTEACLSCHNLYLIITILYDRQRLSGLDLAAFCDYYSFHCSAHFCPDVDFFRDWSHAPRGGHARRWMEQCL